MKYVIANADDFGYRPEVSKAIIESHLKGVLTETSVLVNSITKEEVELALKTSTLGFGLHLNITSGEPMSDRWKKKYGSLFRPKRNEPEQFNREIWFSFIKKFETEDVYYEYKAQIKSFKDMFGRLPSHIDSHHYTSAFSNIFPAFVKIAKEYKLPVRRQVLFDFTGNQHPMGNIDHITQLNLELAKDKIKTTNYFSLLYFNRYENYLEVIESEISKIKDNESIELSFHPGLEENWRKRDLGILKDKKLKLLLKKLNCKLASYREM